MKNCFKTVLAAVAVLVWLGASAQDDPSKETVIINPFTHTSAVSQAACDNIRAAVLSGFADRGRFHIVDALTDGTLSKLYADRNVEDVVNDANWKSESEAAYKALGARKVVIGQANNVSFSQFKSDIDGKMYNKAEVTYSLKVYNIADGAMIGSEDLSVSGIDADSKDGAFNDAMVGDFMKQISTRMATKISTGQSVAVRFTIDPGSAINMDTEINNIMPLSDILVSWVKRHAKNGKYHTQGRTSTLLAFSDIFVDNSMEDGMQSDVNDFALALYQYLKGLNLSVSRTITGNSIDVIIY